MPDYVDPPIITAPTDLSDLAFQYLEDQIDGWLPSPGNLEVWLIEAIAQMAAELMDVASAVPTSIFRYFGSTILGLQPHDATSAQGVTTWTATDDLGYTIPAGTTIGLPAAGDVLLAFEVSEDALIEVGTTMATGVQVVALETGTQGNGLEGDAEVIDALDWVAGVTVDGPTSGGVDGETDAEYLNRLTNLATLLSPRPILPNDFAVLALSVPGVGRATAIDLYNLDTGTSNVPRCVTVIVADAEGQALTPELKAQIDNLLQSQREVNFLAFVGDPTYTTIDVAFTVKVYPDTEAVVGAGDLVVEAAEQAVIDYLNPASFGAISFAQSPTWLPDATVRYLEVAEVINRVEGVWYIGTLTINGGTADVPLAPVGGLPQAGSVTGDLVP